MEKNEEYGTVSDEIKGFRKNAAGHLVPVDQIKPLDLLRDELVRDLFAQAMKMKRFCDAARADALNKIDALVALAAQEHKVKLGGAVGNLTLQSYDGEIKILRAVEKTISFDEQLLAAKELIYDCLKEWTEGARPELRALVDDAFRTDKAGKLSVDRILSLRRLPIKDERWVRAMEAISESIKVDSSKVFLRFYTRSGKDYVQQEVRL